MESGELCERAVRVVRDGGGTALFMPHEAVLEAFTPRPECQSGMFFRV